ncbi:Uncharacterized protein TCM_024520 [Theobroma cacao]|uniref:Uncharacterized protein n=1 Tax=Theobroma cacao TaxID=3641 RepID=A0A061EXK5_THECC|nr:Uncharacterized protein TCM_024520 [Theobroma cacao]
MHICVIHTEIFTENGFHCLNSHYRLITCLIIWMKKEYSVGLLAFEITGGLARSGGLLGFVFRRNPTSVLFGGALLALCTFCLKIWRQGKSSVPGQAALAAVLFWKGFQTYSLLLITSVHIIYFFLCKAVQCCASTPTLPQRSCDCLPVTNHDETA